MSAYDNDPRVTAIGSGRYWVELEGVPSRPGSQDGYVFVNVDGSADACFGSQSAARRPFDAADKAFYWLIGDPR